MAWNEPGGNKPKDPWNNGKDRDKNQGQQGPPDLDEVFKKLLKSLGFGNNGSSNGGRSNGGGYKMPSMGLIIVGLVLIAAFVLINGFYTVEQAEKAVVLRFGKLASVESAGLHWRIPIVERVLKVDVEEVQVYDHEAHMITRDQNIVQIGLNVQYRVNKPTNFFLAIEKPVVSLEQATSSALRHVVGGMSMDSVLTEDRDVVANDVKEKLQKYLEDYQSGLQVTKVSIENSQPPTEVKDSFDDVIKAKEDKDRFVNEAEAYRKQVVPEARGQGQRVLEEASAYKAEMIEEARGDAERFNQVLVAYEKAPKVTRERLYLETLETIYSESPKVFMDANSSGNLMYLPLEQMMNQQTESTSSSRESARETQKPSANVNQGLLPLQIPPATQSTARMRSEREGR